MKKRKAIFFDRDGVLNRLIWRKKRKDSDEEGYCSPEKIENFKLVPDAQKVLEEIKDLEFTIIVLTNQPDIARGSMSQETVCEMHKILRKNLPIDDIFICPHTKENGCICRKPKPGMLLEAIKKWGIDPHRSYMVGDSESDIQAGKKAGCKTVLIKTEWSKHRKTTSDYTVGSISEILDIVRGFK